MRISSRCRLTRERWLMDGKSQLNGDQHGDRFAQTHAWREPPGSGRAQSLLVQSQAGIERSQHAQSRARAGCLHDALDYYSAFDARAHRFDRVLRLFLVNRHRHRHAAADRPHAVADAAIAARSDSIAESWSGSGTTAGSGTAAVTGPLRERLRAY